jgi:lipopolysaccharide export system permease protein
MRAPTPARAAAGARGAGGGVKILDRYLFGEFVWFLVLGLAGLVSIILVVDVIEKIDVFLDNRASLGLISRFYLFRIPEILVHSLPIALLLATFLALGQLNKFGELTAMRVSGLSLLRILLPVFAVAFGCVLFTLGLSESIVPAANRERDRIYDEKIQHVRREAVTERSDVTYLGEGGRIFYMRLYLIRERRMHEVTLQEFSHGELSRRIDAAEATWDGRRWVFSSGYVRTFDGGKEIAHPFERMAVSGIAETPDDLSKEVRQPGEMNYLELASYVTKLRASGARVANYLVDLHLKLAFPLINLIVVMIGSSLATRLRMQSAALGFGLSAAIAFLYYVLMRTGQALGYNGVLPPYAAAWMGDALFGGVALAMFAQAQRR